MTRDDLRHLVDVTGMTGMPGDELEIVPEPEPGHDDARIEIDAREGADAAPAEPFETGDEPEDDDVQHPLPVSPEMIGLPAPTSDLLPRRRRFLLRTRPAVTEPHVDVRVDLDGHAEVGVEVHGDDTVDLREMPRVVDTSPRAAPSDRPDLAGFRLPGTRAPHPPSNPPSRPHARLAVPAAEHEAEPVVDDVVGTRPDRRARRRSRHARTLALSTVALLLLAVAVVISVLTLVVR